MTTGYNYYTQLRNRTVMYVLKFKGERKNNYYRLHALQKIVTALTYVYCMLVETHPRNSCTMYHGTSSAAIIRPLSSIFFIQVHHSTAINKTACVYKTLCL